MNKKYEEIILIVYFLQRSFLLIRLSWLIWPVILLAREKFDLEIIKRNEMSHRQTDIGRWAVC